MFKYVLKAIGIAALVIITIPYTSAFQRNGLVWSDEFDGPAGTLPDLTKWGFDIGTGYSGWGNNELEYYTNRTNNVYLDGNGNLVIKATKETYTGSDGITRSYTSARLVTRGLFEHAYGRIEARIKIPFGQGIWPAFWMLGANINSVGWPNCGEIDIMENIGREPSVNHGSLHGPNYSGGNPLTGVFTLPNNVRLSDDFHVYAIEWDPTQIRFYLDGTLYETQSASTLNSNQTWVFDHPFYMLLNVAGGGGWPGSPDATTVFPQVMTVDYVRVYAQPRTNNPARRTP